MTANDNTLSRTPTNASATAPEIAAVPLQDEASSRQPREPVLGHDGIEYRYMDFDTHIPTVPALPPGADIQLPPCPDLTKYTSPYEWPRLQKQLMTYLSCSVNACAAYASGSYAAPEEQLTQKWGLSHVVFTLGITVFTLGFGIAPMILAPFSEINGRRPVFIATGILFVAMQLACALTPTFGGMLVCRFLMGVGGSTFSTMVGGILSDIWQSSERNTAMVLFTGATLFGTGLGPLVSGTIAQRLLWRWVFYVQIFTSGSLVSLVLVFFKETRGSIILSKKAKAINKWYAELESLGAVGMQQEPPHGTARDPEKAVFQQRSSSNDGSRVRRIRFKVLADEERASITQMIASSLYRPVHMLFTEPVVFFFSLWISFAWAILYLQFGSIPLVYRVIYDFTLEQTGFVFTAMCVGGILSTILCIWQEGFMKRNFPKKMESPEGRMLPTCVEALFLPISLFWFGWTCYSSIHWIVPTMAITLATMGIFSIFLAVFNYSADTYYTFTSSALAASGVCRNTLGGAFPLVTHQLFNNLGFQAASSLLGGIAAVLTLVPIVLVWKGPDIRARSRIAREFLEKNG